jgi:hypothetical protein
VGCAGASGEAEGEEEDGDARRGELEGRDDEVEAVESLGGCGAGGDAEDTAFHCAYDGKAADVGKGSADPGVSLAQTSRGIVAACCTKNDRSIDLAYATENCAGCRVPLAAMNAVCDASSAAGVHSSAFRHSEHNTATRPGRRDSGGAGVEEGAHFCDVSQGGWREGGARQPARASRYAGNSGSIVDSSENKEGSAALPSVSDIVRS